jgi:hypothetical protein
MSRWPLASERFESKLDRTAGQGPWGDCITWTGLRDKGGYGRLVYQGKLQSAHQVAWQLARKKSPVRPRELDHRCCIRNCVNVDHLRVLTHRDNVLVGNGLAAKYARRTHCNAGHPLTQNNLRKDTNRRRCLICDRAYKVTYMRKRRALAE